MGYKQTQTSKYHTQLRYNQAYLPDPICANWYRHLLLAQNDACNQWTPVDRLWRMCKYFLLWNFVSANIQQTHLEYLEAKHKVSVNNISVIHILTLALEAANMSAPQAPPSPSPIRRWMSVSRDGIDRMIQRVRSSVQGKCCSFVSFK